MAVLDGRRRPKARRSRSGETASTTKNALFYGDNLDVLRRYAKDESVDLVYLDPPFKSNQDYNVLFAEHGTRSAAQIKAFEDTWSWDEAAARVYEETVERGGEVAQAMRAFRTLLSTSDMLAYLSMMAPRLVELHRVLKSTGSLYLHCDPAASHYLKLLLDAVFGPRMFRSEVIWKRSSAHSSSKRFSPVHDTILFYSKTDSYRWTPVYQPLPQETIDHWYNNIESETGRRYNRADLTAAGVRSGPSGMAWRGIDPSKKGRHWAIPGFVGALVKGKGTLAALDALDAAGRIHWPKRRGGMPMLKRYLEEARGVPALDVVTHISPLNNVAAERLGYPTQKPEALLELLITASSNEGDTVLDPFCGCGTTVAVAQRLNRRWIGIDITHLAINLIRHRLQDAYGDGVATSYRVIGEPVTVDEAEKLAREDPYQFQWWALGLVGARAVAQKKGADRGIDGRLFFHDADGGTRDVIFSVKGGRTGAGAVRDLRGVVERENAALGVFITLRTPTQPMRVEAASAGFFASANSTFYSRLQVLTVEELLNGRTIQYPPTGPGVPRQPEAAEQLTLKPEPRRLPPRPPSVAELVDDLLRKAHVQSPPVRLEPIMEHLGMELSARPGQREDALLVGMSDRRAGRPTAWMVYYNPERPETRRRFTIAHEIGHVLLHGDDMLAAAARGGGGSRMKKRERDVERFAATLLMPSSMVQQAVHQYGTNVDRLRALFLVSRRAMEIRLRELGLTPSH